MHNVFFKQGNNLPEQNRHDLKQKLTEQYQRRNDRRQQRDTKNENKEQKRLEERR